MSDYIAESSDWTFELIAEYDREIGRIAKNFGLDTYPNQIEVITSEQMMDAYSSVGMPVGYHHWSFGKKFLDVETHYKRGQMGLAYEIVINSNPCIVYLMEENTLTMQALVIAHAAYGHNSFFKNNYLFQTWTNADSIIDYLLFARNYIDDCEKRHGSEEVEQILDSCHALMNYGVYRYKHPSPLSAAQESARQKEREEYLQTLVNDLWRTLPLKDGASEKSAQQRFPSEPEENILYFIEKNAPLLEPWQREIIRIVRKISQYFYPQRQTQVMNEGWACFWHYTILNQLHDEGLVNDGFILEFLQSHTNVVAQRPYDSKYYNGINPYALGYSMMQDIRRICENPDGEDYERFPEIAGSNWLETLDFAMRNFKDESFIAQYLSPKIIRDMKLFAILDDDQKDAYEITSIHDEHGYTAIRQALVDQYNIGSIEPDIQVYNVDLRGDRALTLRHTEYNRRPLGDTTEEMLKHVKRLWQFPVRMEKIDQKGNVKVVAKID